MVPQNFCSYHQDVITTDPTQSNEPTMSNKFSENSIPVGMWPPQNHQTDTMKDAMTSKMSYLSQQEAETGSRTWPNCNNIAFVLFQCEKKKQVECVKCLIQHTEVFLAYNDETYSSGYVWMRQAPSAVLKSCIGKDCTSLFYDEHRTQLQRPVGLRQLSGKDISQANK